eukprot:TRINITY_DN10569_c0_g2_i4.p2 TRINITY_DN10569_c0_g2~~TRINITY_DN10569_c0_g2_i4.p2  ORF type:complete len:264 (-),score=29.65 TRINITY_DN10569_c0_g2_i4:1842-2597(-)
MAKQYDDMDDFDESAYYDIPLFIKDDFDRYDCGISPIQVASGKLLDKDQFNYPYYDYETRPRVGSGELLNLGRIRNGEACRKKATTENVEVSPQLPSEKESVSDSLESFQEEMSVSSIGSLKDLFYSTSIDEQQIEELDQIYQQNICYLRPDDVRRGRKRSRKTKLPPSYNKKLGQINAYLETSHQLPFKQSDLQMFGYGTNAESENVSPKAASFQLPVKQNNTKLSQNDHQNSQQRLLQVTSQLIQRCSS